MIDSISLSWMLLPIHCEAYSSNRRQYTTTIPSARWDRPNARNRSHCRSISLREVILFQIFSSSIFWVWSTSIARLHIYICIPNCSIIGRAINAYVCARSSPAACSCTCSYCLPCRRNHQEFSWKLTRKDQVYRHIVRRNNYVVRIIHIETFIAKHQSILV